VVACLLGLDQAAPRELLEHKFGKKGAAVLEENHKALENSYAWASRELTKKEDLARLLRLPPTSRQAQAHDPDGQ